MRTFSTQTQEQRLRRVLDESWDILSQRIATGRVRVNKEASLQLHYASIMLVHGELLCVELGETFTVELESDEGDKNIDITCDLGGARAAVELKCFRKASNRPLDIDMYDVLRDLERLSTYTAFTVRKFICLTDNKAYVMGAHGGHAGSVSIRDGEQYQGGVPITPSWAGTWKDKSRDRPLTLSKDVVFQWTQNADWYSLSIDV